MNWLQEKVNEGRDQAMEQLGRQNGLIEAYKQMSNWMNPEITCQKCGYKYDTWHDDKAKRRIDHDNSHLDSLDQT